MSEPDSEYLTTRRYRILSFEVPTILCQTSILTTVRTPQIGSKCNEQLLNMQRFRKLTKCGIVANALLIFVLHCTLGLCDYACNITQTFSTIDIKSDKHPLMVGLPQFHENLTKYIFQRVLLRLKLFESQEKLLGNFGFVVLVNGLLNCITRVLSCAFTISHYHMCSIIACFYSVRQHAPCNIKHHYQSRCNILSE